MAFLKSKAFWMISFLLLIAVVIIGLIGADIYTREYRQRAETYNLEEIDKLEQPSIILDRNGKEIGRIFVQNRSVIPIDQVPEMFIKTLIAGEDSRFWEHKGVDYIGTTRAVWLTMKGSSQGGSTITQQLARNAYPLKEEAAVRKESTLQRKLVEAFLAQRIEKRYSKREILASYLNRIYFGSGFYGIRSASLGYFGKEPMQLTQEECASLVTLIKNPYQRSPLNDPTANKEGRNYVLSRMVEEKMLSAADYTELRAKPLVVNSQPLRRGTSHLYERIAEAVTKALGEDALAAGDYKVHTTIDSNIQNVAQKKLSEVLSSTEARPDYQNPKYQDYKKSSGKPAEYLQGAVLMIDHENGEVLAHVGGRDYAQVPYDFIELGRRPLGTAFFPWIYAAGLSNGQSPVTLLEDEPMDNRNVMIGGREGILGEWGMETLSPAYKGKITAREGLEHSKIGATVRFSNTVGLQKIVDTSVAFGLPLKKAELLPRLAVGFEQISMKEAVLAMSVFPRGGMSSTQEIHYLDRIEKSDGGTAYRRTRFAKTPTRVVDDVVAWQVHSMMAGSVYRGSSRGVLDNLLEKPFNGAGKGGTTHDFADTWFLGYNKRVTCGVWTGFLNGNQPIYEAAFSRDLAMPVWQAVMNAATPSFGGGKLSPPESVAQVPVCSVSGQRATQFCQEHFEDPATGTIRTRSAETVEYLRKDLTNLPFCSQHSGMLGDGNSLGVSVANLPAIDASPIRPKEPVIIGDDPYHCELPSFAAVSSKEGFHRRTNVLDSLDLGEHDERIPLSRPVRVDIEDE